jgi:hypothetical protein
MIQAIKRYFAIRSYVKRLSRELLRRFGRKPLYTVENVTHAVHRGRFPAAFIIYAHAIYCSEEDFGGLYGNREVAGDYFKLRRMIAARYLDRRVDFNAQTICDKYWGSAYSSGGFYESGIGITGSEAGHQ